MGTRPHTTPAALRSRGRVFAGCGDIDAARRLFASADEIEAALAVASDPAGWATAAAADVAPLFGFTPCDCGQWVGIESEYCEQCGAAVLPF